MILIYIVFIRGLGFSESIYDFLTVISAKIYSPKTSQSNGSATEMWIKACIAFWIYFKTQP